MIFLYVTPSGSVNLIEGEKMPPQYHSSEWYTKYSESHEHANPNQSYEADLQAAKASSVPVDDQERGKEIIYTSGLPEMDDHLNPQPDTFYGPFDIEYEIKESQGSLMGYVRHEADPAAGYLGTGFTSLNIHKQEVAILTPSKSGELKLTPEQVKEREEAINWYRGEPVGKLEEKEGPDFKRMAIEYLGEPGQLVFDPMFEPALMVGFIAGCEKIWRDYVKKERFIITRKQPL